MKNKLLMLIYALIIVWTLSSGKQYQEAQIVNEVAIESETIEEVIFNILVEKIGNETSACAIMGNLKQESNLCPHRYESDYSPNYEQSLAKSEETKKNKQEFISSPYAFGLAQWTGSHNLSRMWNYCEENGLDPSEVETQIDFLCYDLETNYPRLWQRLKVYEPKHIVVATEDFRQSYEKSVLDINSQYMRARSSKYYFLTLASNLEEDVVAVADAYYDFQIEHQVQRIQLEAENETD